MNDHWIEQQVKWKQQEIASEIEKIGLLASRTSRNRGANSLINGLRNLLRRLPQPPRVLERIPSGN